MGCVKGKSQIQAPKPGQILLYTGISEFDKVYDQCEKPLKELLEFRTELDIRTTDFIKSLGAEKNWERRGNLKEVVTMMLVVLSAAGKGNLDSINVSYTHEVPFIKVSMDKLGMSTKRMMKNFEELVIFMDDLPKKLNRLVEKINKYAARVSEFTKEIARKTQEKEFSMKDKLTAIKNTDHNGKYISKAPEDLTELLRISEEAKERIYEACDEAQASPNSDLLITRGVQASAEGLKNPKSIVERFWPIL